MNNKFLTLLAASSLAFFMQACGDDSSSSSAPGEDAEQTATAASVYVFGTDYTAGELHAVKDGKVASEGIEFHQDAKLVSAGGNLFVLERYGADNLVLFNTEKNEVTWQVSLDDFSNPADVVMASKDEAWVALDGADKLIKVAVKDGKTKKTVNTGDFAIGEDGNPHATDLEVSGDTLFVLFNRYYSKKVDTNFVTVYPNGLVAMYKLSDGELLDTISLVTQNPMAMAKAKAGIFVASQGDYNDAWGTDADDNRGIEKLDLSKKSSKLFVSGKKLGGGVSAMAVNADDNEAYVAIYKSYGDVPVVEVDLEKGDTEIIKGVADAEGSIAVDQATGKVYIGDRSYGEESVYVYDGDKVEKIDNGKALPPYSIVLL